MRIQIKTLETQSYEDLILTLDIISSDIATISNRLSNNHFKFKVFSAKGVCSEYLFHLEEDNQKLKKELKDLTEYLNQIISQLN